MKFRFWQVLNKIFHKHPLVMGLKSSLKIPRAATIMFSINVILFNVGHTQFHPRLSFLRRQETSQPLKQTQGFTIYTR